MRRNEPKFARDGIAKDGESPEGKPILPLWRILHPRARRIDGLRIAAGSVAEYSRAKAEGRGVLLARRDDGTYEVAGEVNE